MVGQHKYGEILPADLPAPPREAIEIVRACSQSDVNSKDLANIVTHNPVLTAELLRVVNSPYFGFAQNISSVTRAVTLMGQRALRNLVLCISMRDAIRDDAIKDFPVKEYWESALRRAACARNLAEIVSLDTDDCFTIGLLQEFGLLAMFFIMPDCVKHWEVMAESDPDERQRLEKNIFGQTHDEVNLLLASAWQLPEDLSMAISGHHQLDLEYVEPKLQRLVKLAYCTDWMSAVFSAKNKRKSIDQCRKVLQTYFSLSIEVADELLANVSTSVEQAAVAMGLEVTKQISFEQVLRDANLRLVEDNISYQELTWRLEKALAERDQYADELQKDLDLAREVQKSLLPTNSTQCKGISGINHSAKAVSGDFYDFFEIKDGRIYFCIADVSGKGMNAALLMAKTSSLFHCLGKGLHVPSKLVTMLNQEICERSIRGMFVTMVLGLFDPKIGKVTIVNAGHLPAIHMLGGKVISLYPALSPPLGVLDEVEFPAKELYLRGGSLYLVTDGLLEARLENGQRLGREGMISLFRQSQRLSPRARLEKILSSVKPADGSTEDDITILMIEE